MVWSHEIVGLIILGGLTGFMAGCTGIGGVFLVPGLIYGLGMGVHDAISAVMLAFIASGGVGLWAFARRKSIRWDMAVWLFLSTAPFAFLGSWTIDWISAQMLLGILSLLTLSSGLHSFVKPAAQSPERPILTVWLGPIGAVTGFLSALTGTGGAVVLMPILLALNVPPLTAIGLSTSVQLPIAAMATLGNYASGNLNVRTGLILSVVFTAGLFSGVRFAHVLPQKHLRILLIAMLLAVGSFIGVRALHY